MLQSPLTATLRPSIRTGAVAACLVLSGCTSFQPSSLHTASVSLSGAAVPSPRIASSRDGSGTLSAARPFAWTAAARIASGEHLETISIGDGEYRTLVIGSVGGHDPLAVGLTEELARNLQANSIIIGGIQSTILRTLNPDGLRRQEHRNAAGIYLNNQFPSDGSMPDQHALVQLPAEVQFVMNYIKNHRPQRIIHVRSVKGDEGLVAASRGAAPSAREVSEWLGFKLQKLPESVRGTTLESWAAQRENCDVVTFGIPRNSDKADVWPLYGDAIVSLMQDGNTESRQIVRRQKQRQASRNRFSKRGDNRGSSTDMFSEDTAQGLQTTPFD